MNEVTRICDMRDGCKLTLHKQEDGDIVVCILPEKHRFSTYHVEFCNSGTQSPKTYRALIALFKAMKEDAEDGIHHT